MRRVNKDRNERAVSAKDRAAERAIKNDDSPPLPQNPAPRRSKRRARANSNPSSTKYLSKQVSFPNTTPHHVLGIAYVAPHHPPPTPNTSHGEAKFAQSMLRSVLTHRLRSILTPGQYLRRRKRALLSTAPAARSGEMDACNTAHKVIIVGGGPAGTSTIIPHPFWSSPWRRSIPALSNHHYKEAIQTQWGESF